MGNREVAVLDALRGKGAEMTGCELREAIRGKGHRVSGPEFYLMMANLETTGHVAGETRPKVVEGVELSERVYRLT